MDRLGEEPADAVERTLLQAVERVGPSLLPLEQACVDELLEMVADGRLFHTEDGLEVADADGVLAGLEQAVEDLQAVPVGERLEEPLEPGGVVRGQRRDRDRRSTR